ncbi:hypothetical protein G8O24_26355 [Bradyrhizobium sp. INPA01-394B]|uniref:Uncharacterized protein n=1 Tax=Bradyrhizobium campsiandrae TaxID=1729892 RepID=A0ABR7UD04_9BRAD|nr:hypothetical protein [Bradyrhizobium campsiandrae]MBC9880853.1 hypothetical protein [Bradyrhizobium campsiandrae]MBC9981787.1 hypothetical protein [Bradyrhizobium campsiandrae]
MAASLPARVSYYLEATLLSKPSDIFAMSDFYSDLTTWRAECSATRLCRFDINARFYQQGVDITIMSRGAVEK